MATEGGRDVPHSAVQYVRNQLGLQVCAIATLADLLQYLQGSDSDSDSGMEGRGMAVHHERVLAYRARYGVNGDMGRQADTPMDAASAKADTPADTPVHTPATATAPAAAAGAHP